MPRLSGIFLYCAYIVIGPFFLYIWVLEAGQGGVTTAYQCRCISEVLLAFSSIAWLDTFIHGMNDFEGNAITRAGQVNSLGTDNVRSDMCLTQVRPSRF